MVSLQFKRREMIIQEATSHSKFLRCGRSSHDKRPATSSDLTDTRPAVFQAIPEGSLSPPVQVAALWLRGRQTSDVTVIFEIRSTQDTNGKLPGRFNELQIMKQNNACSGVLVDRRTTQNSFPAHRKSEGLRRYGRFRMYTGFADRVLHLSDEDTP